MVTRSQLELMLDKIRQLEDHPKDVPPALPVRPVSRARLPRARRPLPLDSQKGNCQESDVNFKWSAFESKRTKRENHAENGEVAATSAPPLAFKSSQSDHLPNWIEGTENSKELEEKGISNIQKCYRGHKVRCYYEELRRGAVPLQSFVRGENARRDYECRSKRIRAIVLIQKQIRKYLERKVLEEQRDLTRVPCCVLIDLHKRMLRTEAKVREKKEETIALKTRLREMEKKWQQYEERMKSMEKSWQDQLTCIQKSLAARKKNLPPGIRIRQFGSGQRHYDQNLDTNTKITGIPNGRSQDFVINPIDYEDDPSELVYSGDYRLTEVGVCHKLQPDEELQKLKIRFKTWKRDYKNKLREVQSTFKKLGNSETAKVHKQWWGRLSSS